ncbi:MAG: hypothetical protein ACI4O7_07965 [Aristaeellaceae bacterium]
MALVLALIPLVLIIVCFVKESSVTGLYKTFGVYGRLYGYLTTTFLLGSVCLLGGGIASMFVDTGESAGVGGLLLALLGAAVCLAIGVFMFLGARMKCPEFLRGKLLISMLITGFGVAAKICLFFLGFVWKLVEPTSVTLANGQSAYIYCGEVYSSNGLHLGTVNGNSTFTPNSNYVNNNY